MFPRWHVWGMPYIRRPVATERVSRAEDASDARIPLAIDEDPEAGTRARPGLWPTARDTLHVGPAFPGVAETHRITGEADLLPEDRHPGRRGAAELLAVPDAARHYRRARSRNCAPAPDGVGCR